MYFYLVSYYLGDFFHCYAIKADNEYYAIKSVFHRLPPNSRKIFHNFKIERK